MLQQIKIKVTLKRVSASIGLFLLVFVALSSPMSAQSVTQGYQSDKILQRGTIVSLEESDASKVVASSRANQERIHGVVVAANDAPLTISGDSQKTFVATVGRYDTLVSTEGGAILPGDFLTISSITGIAKKAGQSDAYTVGKSVSGYDGSSNQISKTSITDSIGNTIDVSIGRIETDIAVGSNPLLKPADSTLPEFLEDATEAIAGKKVSPVKVYVGVIILLAASAIAGSLLFSGVRSSVISVGRNPLSKKSITKSLFQIILTSIIIFLIGLFAVYLLLRL